MAASVLVVLFGLGATPANAACTPVSASGVNATCTGDTNGGTYGYGDGALSDLSVTVESEATVTGVSAGIHANELDTVTNFGTVTGGQQGVYGFASTDNVINYGTIVGTASDGVANNVSLGSLTNYGTISGGVRGVLSGTIGSLNNFGTITGVNSFGIFATTVDELNNSGTINGGQRGLQINGALSKLINSGIINGSAQYGMFADSFGILFNSGTISGGSVGVFGNTITSLTNSGTIIGGASAITENNGGGDTLLTLLPGSNIQGTINLGDTGTDTLDVGLGLNLATTFTGLPGVISSNGALMATSGTLVGVADTSVLAAEAGASSQMTGAVSGLLQDRLAKEWGLTERNVWAKGFGGASQTRTLGHAIGTNNYFGGAMTGADAVLFDSSLQLGLFAGFSAGAVEVNVNNGQRVTNSSYFGGAYGRFDAEAFYLNFGLTGGITNNSSNRLVANNLVSGGLETATAHYNSYFVTPEITIAADMMQDAPIGFTPSLRLRYSLLQSDGYTEAGLTAGALTIGSRTSQIIDASLQLAVPIDVPNSDTKLAFRAGIDGQLAVGDSSFDAALLGTSQRFDAGGANSAISGFVGASFDHNFSDTASIFSSVELSTGTQSAFAANAEIGLKMKLK